MGVQSPCYCHVDSMCRNEPSTLNIILKILHNNNVLYSKSVHSTGQSLNDSITPGGVLHVTLVSSLPYAEYEFEVTRVSESSKCMNA